MSEMAISILKLIGSMVQLSMIAGYLVIYFFVRGVKSYQENPFRFLGFVILNFIWLLLFDASYREKILNQWWLWAAILGSLFFFSHFVLKLDKFKRLVEASQKKKTVEGFLTILAGVTFLFSVLGLLKIIIFDVEFIMITITKYWLKFL